MEWPGSATANRIGGEWRPAASGAVARGPETGEAWPQSGLEDVTLAAQAARAGVRELERLSRRALEERVLALARALEGDEGVRTRLAARAGLELAELSPHLEGSSAAVREALARPTGSAPGVSWCASDWRELVRAPLEDLARELCAGRAVVLLADSRAPELATALACAAVEAELPAGAVGLLHGATRELLGLALATGADGSRVVASGPVERMGELRRACEARAGTDARLRALRCRAHEVDPGRPLDASAAEVVELAFGRATTLSGQLAGTLGRVFCPARSFSAFSAALLAELERSPAARAPVPQIDEESAARVRAAWELGLDEGATCIAGGNGGASGRVVPPTVFTNVELHMQSARRQEPLPVLCLLRSS